MEGQVDIGKAGPMRVAMTALAMTLVVLVAFVPSVPRSDPTPRPPTGEQRWIPSPDGRLAVRMVRAASTTPADPIIVVHGGPGVSDPSVEPFYAKLATSGRVVWFYDQIGSGASTRLADPRQYTLERDIADLDRVRRAIGAERVLLIGQSWGATLAAHYAARHPKRVSGLVFSSPGRLIPIPGDAAGTAMINRLSRTRQMQVAATLFHPRSLLVYTLTKVNPKVARNIAGDREMDARFAHLYDLTSPGLTCGRAPLPPAASPGFYTNQVHNNSRHIGPDIRPALRRLTVPTLVVRGECDYLPRRYASEYRSTFRSSTLIELASVGHQLSHDRPHRYLALLKDFLHPPAPDRSHHREDKP